MATDGVRVDFDFEDKIISCQIEERQTLATVTCFSKNSAKVVFRWTNIGVDNFEEIHGLSRILLMFPDKLATACAINEEYLTPPDSGSFLVGLVHKLLTFYATVNSRRKISTTFVDTVNELIHMCELFAECLDYWRPQQELFVLAHAILDKCKLFFAAVKFYLNYLHRELLNRIRGIDLSSDLLLQLVKEQILETKDELKNDFLLCISRDKFVF
jgi:hypothetical protein